MKIRSVKSSQEFARSIEKIVSEKNTDYFDALMIYMTENNLEIEVVASLVKENQNIKSKLYDECMRLNLVEKIATLQF